MRKRVLGSMLVLLLVPARAALSEWNAYTSANFTLYSDADEEETTALLENFEVFRLVTLAMLNRPDAPESERLTIIAFDESRDFGRISGMPGVGGFFYHSIFGPRMIIRVTEHASATQQILFHEYVHYLMNLRSAVNYPPWYREGLASVLETTEIASAAIFVWKAPQNYLWALALGFDASVHDMIDPDFRGEVGEFYRTSWLLTHCFFIDSFSNPERKQRAVEYLRRYDAGEDTVDAFTESLGVSPTEMQREIVAYSRRGTLPGLQWPRIEYAGEVSRRALTQGEDMYILGDIAVERDLYRSAHYYFDRFERLGVETPFSANVMSRKAIAYIHEERIDEGDALVEQLIALETDDADVLADIAHYEFDRYTYGRDHDGDSGLGHLNRSIEYGKRAVEADPKDIEALYYLGLANELSGDLQVAVDTLLLAYDLNPSIPRLNINLARVLVKGGQSELASYLIGRLYSGTHSAEQRARFRDLQRSIDDGTIDVTKLDAP